MSAEGAGPEGRDGGWLAGRDGGRAWYWERGHGGGFKPSPQCVHIRRHSRISAWPGPALLPNLATTTLRRPHQTLKTSSSPALCTAAPPTSSAASPEENWVCEPCHSCSRSVVPRQQVVTQASWLACWHSDARVLCPPNTVL